MATGTDIALDPNHYSAFGTADDDHFFTPQGNFLQYDWSHVTVSGGAGNDALILTDTSTYDLRKFASFSGIEEIYFSSGGGDLYLSAQQLATVNLIYGSDAPNQARIYLSGGPLQTYDLRGKTFENNYILLDPSLYADIVIGDKSQLFAGENALLNFSLRSGARIHLVGNTFTDAERALLYRRGASYVWDDSDNSAGNAAPALSGLNGDRIETKNLDPAYIDVGSNAVATDDEGIRKISVKVLNANADDWVDIDYFSSIELPNGLVEGGTIRDKTVFNSKVFADLYNVTNSSFDIVFNGNATSDAVNKVVHALIYYNSGSAASANRQIQVSVSDGADKTTTSTVAVTHTAEVKTPPSGGKTVGNDDANVIKGGTGKDVIAGGAGDDTISGGLGNDVLTGGAGKDVFVFDTKLNRKTNLDKIADFSVRDDTIWLDNKYMSKLGKGTELKPGKLNKAFFTIGDHAKDKNDYLVYDSKKGVLYYDADGSGNGKAVEIATLKKGLKMTYHDFFVI
jgi:Ca2+-binding RTX toxin-like protein